jgi:hypothetical protein
VNINTIAVARMKKSLDFKAQVTHTSKVSLNELLTVLFSILENTLISYFFGFGTCTTWFERLSVFTNGKFTGMSRGCLYRFCHNDYWNCSKNKKKRETVGAAGAFTV